MSRRIAAYGYSVILLDMGEVVEPPEANNFPTIDQFPAIYDCAYGYQKNGVFIEEEKIKDLQSYELREEIETGVFEFTFFFTEDKKVQACL